MHSCGMQFLSVQLRAISGSLFFTLILSGGVDSDWHNAPGYRWKDLPAAVNRRTGFTMLPPETTGIFFTNHLSDEAAARNRVLQNGSGVALGDVDGDGWCDIYFCRLEGPNVLYRNLGDWKFEDVTEAAGVACDGQFSTGAVFADLDGDGDLDLLVNCIGGGTRAFLNDGRGHFAEMQDTRLVRKFGSTSMALADIDGDGDLDLYVTNYRTDTHKDIPGLKIDARMADGKVVVTPADRFIALAPQNGAVEVIEKGERDFLYLNDGKGRFAPVSWTAGSFLDEDGKPLLAPPTDWGLSVMFRDMNGDGLPDIYVCNDFFYWPDRVWINDNGQRFRAIPRPALRNQSLSSMAVDFADINRDGYDDFFVAEMLNRDHQARQRHRENVIRKEWNLPLTDPDFRPEVTRNTLQLNCGDGTYAEIAQLSGLAFSDWTWSAIFLDVDLDGYEDLLLTTGHHFDVQDTDTLRELSKLKEPDTLANRMKNLRKFPRLDTEKLAFRNQHDLSFAEMSAPWGFNTIGVSHGMALADLDNDGDLDVVVNNMNQVAGIYRNETGAPRVAVRLRGRPPNTQGIGAKIRLYAGAVPVQSQEMICGGRYLSCCDTMRVFAGGGLTNEMRIEAGWRSGKRSVVNGVRANRIYEIDEAGAQPYQEPAKPQTRPFFREVSERIVHRHQDEPFDDSARQSLLPRRLSQLGPGAAWCDVNGDGWEDLIVGSGRGGRSGIFLNDGNGGFKPAEALQFAQPVARDQAGIVAWVRDRRTVLLVGSANYEDGLAAGPSALQFDLTGKVVEDSLPGQRSSTGPLALADFNGDAHLCLFVGGRVLAGRYPEAASSMIFRDAGGRWELDAENTKRLAQVGLVSGAVWSDLDGDGWPELILACEWGPVKVFRNHGGRLTEATEEWGLTKFYGWWNGVNAGDFDGDGKMDIIASNWGRNTRYQRYLAQPTRIFYGDFRRDGTTEVIEASYDPDLKKVVPWRDLEVMTKALPFVQERFQTRRAYGRASVEEILGDRFINATELQANTLDSMVFLNRGGRFEGRRLPVEAQFAPAFAVCVGDYDGDGDEDVFLSQNFFDVEVETSRYDAGRGLWLHGDGHGNFRAVSAQESGVRAYGEQRGAALCDYNADGRVDLVVTQNSEATKLYHNEDAKPGLRVRLRGPPGNPNGVGAVMRLKHGRQFGPAREIHSGSGYWSQDSVVQVLAASEPATQIWIRWPGGKTSTGDVPTGAREIEVDIDGKIKVLRP
ncbi:MAG: hypothetical protein DME18_03605 [Verrucomicrobia bacterium]|nr:MAG: hypothetical protein DME18_03605 [Verrucomicrobiota bacterium]